MCKSTDSLLCSFFCFSAEDSPFRPKSARRFSAHFTYLEHFKKFVIQSYSIRAGVRKWFGYIARYEEGTKKVGFF